MAQIKSKLDTVLNTAKKSDIAKLKEVNNLRIPSNTGTGKAASSASVPAEYHEFLKEEIKGNHEREKERRDFAEKSASAARHEYLSVISKVIEQVGSGQAWSRRKPTKKRKRDRKNHKDLSDSSGGE